MDSTTGIETGSSAPANRSSTLFISGAGRTTDLMVNWTADRATTLVGFESSAPSTLIHGYVVQGVSSGRFRELDVIRAAEIASGPVSSGFFDRIPGREFPLPPTGQRSMWRIYDHGACAAFIPWVSPGPMVSTPLGTISDRLAITLPINRTFGGSLGTATRLCHAGLEAVPSFRSGPCRRGTDGVTEVCDTPADRLIVTLGISGGSNSISSHFGASFRGFVETEFGFTINPPAPFGSRVMVSHSTPVLYHRDGRTGATESGFDFYGGSGLYAAFAPSFIDDIVTGQIQSAGGQIQRALGCSFSVPLLQPNQLTGVILGGDINAITSALGTSLSAGCNIQDAQLSTFADCAPNRPDPCSVVRRRYIDLLDTIAIVAKGRSPVPSGVTWLGDLSNYLRVRGAAATECRPARFDSNGNLPATSGNVCAVRIPLSRMNVSPSGVEFVLADNILSGSGEFDTDYRFLRAVGELSSTPFCESPDPDSPIAPALTQIRNYSPFLASAPQPLPIVQSGGGVLGSGSFNLSCTVSPSTIPEPSACETAGTTNLQGLRLPACVPCMTMNCAATMTAVCLSAWNAALQQTIADRPRPPAIGTDPRDCVREQALLPEGCRSQFLAFETCRASSCSTQCQQSYGGA